MRYIKKDIMKHEKLTIKYLQYFIVNNETAKACLNTFRMRVLWVHISTAALQMRTALQTRRGKGWKNWESSVQTRVPPRAKQLAGGHLLCGAGSSSPHSVATWRGGMGWEAGGRFTSEGTCVYLWLVHSAVQQKPAQYWKENILQ